MTGIDQFSIYAALTQSTYVDATTLENAPLVSGIFVCVLNASVYYQQQISGVWSVGKMLTPWVGQLDVEENCTGIRFRSTDPTRPARVVATLQFGGSRQQVRVGAPATYEMDSTGGIVPIT